jgi:hypothetical protein
MTSQPKSEILFYAGPLGDQNAVHDTIPNGAVAADGMMAQDTILFCAQTFDRFLRIEIEIIGTQTNHLASQGIEGMREQ